MRNLCLVLLLSFISVSLQYAVDSGACLGKKENDELDTGSPCVTCHCAVDGDQLFPLCAAMACGMCPGEVTDDGSCCGHCDPYPLSCKKKKNMYENGDEVPTKDPCEICYCHADGRAPPEILCMVMECACPGNTIPDGSCCGQCVTDECIVDGKTYKDDEEIITKDPCETCFCHADGNGPPAVQCMMMACFCPGYVVPDGSCCGQCIVENKCVVDGKEYEDGEEIQPVNECAPCFCYADGTREGQVVCAMFDCPLCEGEIVDDGSCCGRCNRFTVGPPISFPVCNTAVCPKLKCKSKDQFQSQDMCCPECKCKVKKNYYNPGETVGDKCDGCVCRNGRIECNPPAACPKISCVDPVRGDDCCYTCPNGLTCSAGKKTVVKEGEFKKVKSQVCMCMTNPWYPNAFCAERKLSKSLFKGLEGEIAEYERF